MIVKHMWSTKKEMPSNFKYRGVWYNYRTKDWIGFFLLGIIPLYIKCIETTYHR